MDADSRDPGMDQWHPTTVSHRGIWTGRGQGVATDGKKWFVTQNDRRPGLSRYSADFGTEEAQVDIPRSMAGHVGALSIHDGVIYVALEGPERIITFDLNLNQLSLVPVTRRVEEDDKPHMAWCAINPANGLIYSCDWNHATRLNAYKPDTGDAVTSADIELAEPVHRAQGGVFSSSGFVYLASDEKLSLSEQIKVWLGPLGGGGGERPIHPGIHGFDAATGAKVGYVRIPTRPHFPHFEEIEGLGLGPMTVNGTETHVHLAMLDKNHSWLSDDIHITSFSVPRLESL